MSRTTDSTHGIARDIAEQPVDTLAVQKLYEAYLQFRHKFVRAEDLEAELDEAIGSSSARQPVDT